MRERLPGVTCRSLDVVGVETRFLLTETVVVVETKGGCEVADETSMLVRVTGPGDEDEDD